ncbi:MAG: type III pantothenate kinase [Christensenellales bacterium]
MILVMDAGNTNIKLGLFDGAELIQTWRVATDFQKTADEYGMTFLNLFQTIGIGFADIEGVILSSVAPTVNYTLEHACKYYFNQMPIVVGPGVKTGLNIKYTNPQEVGADRIVNAVGAYRLYGGPSIIIDFGTATTFGVVTENGEFLGGAIAPGIKSSMEALVNTTAKLPRIELVRPEKIINKNTISNMQSGIINGFIGLVDYMIDSIKKELNLTDCKVIATGGLSQLVVKHTHIDKIDRTLTLKGLKYIYDMNIEGGHTI